IIHPLYHQKKFMEVLKNTNMPEGDLIRLLMRIMDKLEQIDKALIGDEERVAMVRNCKGLIKGCLEGIHMF
ncbi:hypothetical protein KY362_04370, partial [Candidatus Woesearchaeota archaeon]|nr:hypothetical protein [Candidatus Woesearchaeota archaeon]